MELGLTTETKSVTGDLRQTTVEGSRRLARHVGAGVVLASILGLVLWLEVSIYGRLTQLETAWAGLRSGQLAGAESMSASISRMNERLFRFQLTEDVTQREGFHQETRRFAEGLVQARTVFRGDDAVARVEAVGRAFEQYLVDAVGLTERGVRAMRRETPAEVDRLIREKSRALEAAVDRLAELGDTVYADWIAEGQREFGILRRTLIGSGIALVVLLGVAGFQVYRGIMAPLQAELSQAQAAFARQEQLAALGVMAAGVAHEIRNPLTALKFRLFSLKKALPAALVDHPDLSILGKEINRLERIVQDFLEFARPTEPRCATVAAAALVEEVRELMRNELERRGIGVRTEMDAAIEVWADRPQLKQILINLVRNAMESMSAGGVLTLGVREGAASWLRRTRAMVLIEVTDTGTGIPPEVEPRIFDPFYSTKEGGSGLGLSIAARIAELHGGHIQYTTRAGQGTTFTVVLPKPTLHERKDSVDRR